MLVKGSVSTGSPGYASRPAPVAVGVEGEGVSVLVSSELALDGIAEGEGAEAEWTRRRREG